MNLHSVNLTQFCFFWKQYGLYLNPYRYTPLKGLLAKELIKDFMCHSNSYFKQASPSALMVYEFESSFYSQLFTTALNNTLAKD